MTRPVRGQLICGDTFATVTRKDCTLVVLADGLGHGPEAAAASQAFCELVRTADSGLPERIFAESEQALSKTRGAVASMIRIDNNRQTVTFIGVGNVEMRAVSREPMHPITSPGILGRKVRKLRPMVYSAHPGDLFVLFTDGISGRFSLADFAHLPCQALAERLLADFGKYHDDAACAVLRI